MRVLAAKFPDRRVASAVRDVLQHRMHLERIDVDIAPLATGDQEAADDTLLAARCPDQVCAETAEFLRDAGGEIVVNVDEQWTRPRATLAKQAWGSTLRREPVHQ